MSVQPDLAIVIVTFNSAHVIDDLLNSIRPALGPLTADVVVVDNGSTDGTPELLKDRTDCRLILSANVGYAGGINRGVSEVAAADAILILNPDVRMSPRSVPPLMAALNQPGTGVVAPRVESAAGALEFSLRRKPSLLRALGLTRTGLAAFSEHVTEPADYTYPHVVDWALGAALLMSRACYDMLGGWDESFFLYSEETDVSLRAADLGMTTRYEPRSCMVHIGGQSGRTRFTHAMMIINRVRLYRRRHSAAASWCYFLLTVLSELSWLARGQHHSWFAVSTLLRPALRPSQLGLDDTLMPY